MAATLFNHLAAIFENQSPTYFDELSDDDKKSYSTYMINRLVSMNLRYVPLVNELQKYPVTPRESYLFYSQSLPKGRQFNKYIKSAAEKKYAPWLVTLVAKYYDDSEYHAEEYIDGMMLTAEGKEHLIYICQFFGTDPKEIKKLKL